MRKKKFSKNNKNSYTLPKIQKNYFQIKANEMSII